jgi:uncharacterized alpha/beta hydrolase family protein
MKKIFVTLIIVVVIVAGYWLISPFFITTVVNEDSPVVATVDTAPDVQVQSIIGEDAKVVSRGIFSGFDTTHTGSGTATLIKKGENYIVRLEDDFMVQNGPDLVVGFGRDGEYIKGSHVGFLKGSKGSQNYDIPNSVDMSQYNEVWIWCRAFSTPFARAVLQE